MRYILFFLTLIALLLSVAEKAKAFCDSSSMTYMDVEYAGNLYDCPKSVPAGSTVKIWVTYIDAGEDSSYQYEHRSLWKDGTRISCNKSVGSNDCSETWDSFSITLPSTAGTYTYTAKSYAASSLNDYYCGLSEGSTQSCTITTTVSDTTKPTSSITAPAASSNQSSNFSVSVSDSDNTGGSGLDTCSYHVYDSSVGWTKTYTARTCNSSFTVTVGPSGDCRTVGGTCTVHAYAKDVAGNTQDPPTNRAFNIVVNDSTAPTTSITAPDSGSWQKTNFSVSVTDADNTGGSGLSTCYYGVYNNTGIWTVALGTTRTCNSAVTISVGSSSNCRAQGANACTVYMYSKDVAGNTTDPYANRSFGIDYTLPNTPSISSPAAGSGQSADFSVSVSNDSDTGGSGNNCYYHVSDSSVGWTNTWAARTCNSSFTVTVGPSGDCRTRGGTCTVYAVAKDGAGNSIDTNRAFNILNQCSSLSYPDSTWQRVWYDLAGNCLGDGPNEPDITFDKNWNCSGCSGILAYSKNDQIQFFSSRSIYFSAGKYRFALGSDDGSILYLDGSPIINSWSNHGYPSSPPTADIDLTAGYHNLQINYYENDGGARVSFSYYQILPTKVDCAFSNCIFDKTDLQCYGDRVAVGGYLRKTDGTAVAGKPLSLWMKKADGTYEKVVDLGNTDSTGYASKYWRPENTIYWDSKEYIVFWGGDADSQTSQTANYNLTVPHETCGQTDCSSEMIRRGYPSGDCRPNASGACSSYTNKDIVGEVGKCSQSTFFSDVAIWCSGCYSCPNTMPSNVFSIPGSSCTVTITGQGWDADGTIGGYHKFNADGNWREGIMDDNGCGSDNLKIKNTWSVSGNQFNITTNADRLGNTTNNLTAGFNLSSNCKISEVGKVATGGGGSDPNNSPVSCSTAATYKAKTNAGYTTYVFAAKYCGDGVQSCGEVCDPTAPGQSNCKPDCSGMNDATPPVINIGLASPPYSGWLTEGYYFVSITDTDPETGVNINECKYKIEEWNAGGITKVGDKKSLTARTCSEMVGINVGPDSWKLNAQGVNVYKIIATAKNNVGQEGSSELWLKIDYSKPTVR